MTQAERGSRHVHRAAEQERAGRHGESDTESATAHVDVTESKQGRAPLNREMHDKPPPDTWRDKPVDEERDKDIKEGGGIEGAARRERGG
ncbi:MAG TPA: hypothetical protein VMI30_07525 [Stellaceae bacterium]|nr:hypothetical protein [Stellaceae bacterium]